MLKALKEIAGFLEMMGFLEDQDDLDLEETEEYQDLQVLIYLFIFTASCYQIESRRKIRSSFTIVDSVQK